MLEKLSYETTQLNCSNKVSPQTKDVIFVFEGGGVYSPRFFNIVSREDKVIYPDESFKRFFDSYALSLFELKKSNSSTLRFLREQKAFDKDREYFYFSNSDLKAALQCHKDLIGKNIKVIATSWGSNGAHRFIRSLNARNEPIKAVIFFDPVRKGFLAFGALRNILTMSNSRFYKKLQNTELFINHYQKSDDGSLGVAKVRGNSIPSADINLNLSVNCISKEEHIPFVRINHKNIFNCPTLKENFKQFLNKGN